MLDFRAFRNSVLPRALRSSGKKQLLIESSGLFDAEWYCRTYPDAAGSRLEPLEHFVRYGSREIRDPGPQFDAKWYLETYADVREGGFEPFVHYLSIGKAENRPIRASSAHARQLDPKSAAGLSRRRDLVLASGLFDRDWYLRKHRDIAAAGLDPLVHFIQFGSGEFRDPGPNFEAKWYLDEYPEVEESGLEPIFHYIEIGRAKGYASKGPPPYTRWRTRFDTLTGSDIAAIRQHIASVALPKLTVVFVFDRACERSLAATAAHLRDQLYPHWSARFFMSKDCSAEARSRAGEIAVEDSRITAKAVETGADLVAALPNHAIVFARGGMLFRSHSLYMFASYAANASQACIIYSDEDRVNEEGTPVEPRFKPDHSPVLFTQERYCENCFLLRLGDVPARLAPPDHFFDGHFVSALFKRAVAAGMPGIHIPFVLSHDTNAPPPSAASAKKRDLPDLNPLPRVSIIIPTKDKLELLEPCLTSLEAITDYPAAKLQVIVVDNGSVEESTLAYLGQKSINGEIKWLRLSDAFNFSRLNNLAALNSSGEVLLFLNNDIEIIEPSWLKRIVSYAIPPDAGAVGAKLLYPDRSVQHGGVVLGIQGVAAHSHVGLAEAEAGYQDFNLLTREVAAVTGACLAMRREVFFELGGFDCDFAVAFNDTALCLAARRHGYSNIWVSDALLIHHESKSRGFDSTPERQEKFLEEARLARLKYKDQFDRDPFYNSNLSLEVLYDFAYPPRHLRPWHNRAGANRKPRILVLSIVHGIGYGVAVVVDIQASYLARNGFEVFVGGPEAGSEMAYDGCTRAVLKTSQEAAIFAFENNVECIVVHTPPFFSVVRFLDSSVPVVFYDHGEPPPALFPDAVARRQVAAEKRFCSAFAARLIAISEAVRSEAAMSGMIVVPNGNAHLTVWGEKLSERRERVRQRRGWGEKTVVLNVCRFYRAERAYKGVDVYADVFTKIRMAGQADDLVFVLCGRADRSDASEVSGFGLEVCANVDDEELIDLYCAADIYANFSRWEGYNLGIGQALAMGLPVVASDIEAHRAFPAFVSNDTDALVEKLLSMHRTLQDEAAVERRPIVAEWEPSLKRVAQILRELTGTGSQNSTSVPMERERLPACAPGRGHRN